MSIKINPDNNRVYLSEIGDTESAKKKETPKGIRTYNSIIGRILSWFGGAIKDGAGHWLDKQSTVHYLTRNDKKLTGMQVAPLIKNLKDNSTAKKVQDAFENAKNFAETLKSQSTQQATPSKPPTSVGTQPINQGSTDLEQPNGPIEKDPDQSASSHSSADGEHSKDTTTETPPKPASSPIVTTNGSTGMPHPQQATLSSEIDISTSKRKVVTPDSLPQEPTPAPRILPDFNPEDFEKRMRVPATTKFNSSDEVIAGLNTNYFIEQSPYLVYVTPSQISEIDFTEVTFNFMQDGSGWSAHRSLFANGNAQHLSITSFKHLQESFIKYNYPGGWLKPEHVQAIDFTAITLDPDLVKRFLKGSIQIGEKYFTTTFHLTPKQVNDCLVRGFVELDYLTETQVQKVDLSTIQSENVKKYLRYDAAKLSSDQIYYCLQQNLIDQINIRYITDTQLKGIDLSSFDVNDPGIKLLNDRKNKLKEEFIHQFSNTPLDQRTAQQLIEGINAGFFDDHLDLVTRLPEALVNQIDFTQIKILGTEKWKQLFDKGISYLLPWAAIQPSSINCLLPDFIRSDKANFSDEQFTAIDFSNKAVSDTFLGNLIINNFKHTTLLSSEQLMICLGRGLLRYSRVVDIPLKTRQEIDFEEINEIYLYEFTLSIIDSLTPKQLSCVLKKECLRDFSAQNVTDEQLKQIDLDAFNQDYVVVKSLQERKARLI